MTPKQRAALVDLTSAILNCACATPDMRLRAESLRARLDGGFILGSAFSRAFGR